MASIFDRSGNYYAQFYDSDRSPKRKRFSLRTSNRTEARQRLTDFERAYETGEFDPWTDDPFDDQEPSNGPRTVTRAIQQFTAEKEGQGRAERTIESYRQVWGLFVERVGEETEVSELAVRDVEDFIHDTSVAESTRHNRWRHVRAVLKWADAEIVNAVNPPSEPDKLPTPVRKEDLSALTEALKTVITSSAITRPTPKASCPTASWTNIS